VSPLESIRTRFLPAVLTGFGGILLMAGLLTYTNPVTASAPSAQPSVPAASAPLLSFPTVSPTPTGTPVASGPPTRVATRVVVPALGIDLPVVRTPAGTDTYPLCNVAMYLQGDPWRQPGEAGPTYLYAHARTGMFLPLLDASKVNNGQKMVGMLVQVYTSDDQLFLYSISNVYRHVLTFDKALQDGESLWLQTSEGPHGTPQKLQVRALLLSSGPADHADAHPTAHPVVCG
jgi:hypothetical protein